MYELAQKFADFKVPNDFRKTNFIKMMLFANETKLTNDDIDYYMSIPPRRQEDESYEDMKQRNKLANAMLKYRSQLYDYSVYENN
jgi:hypothetical protein